MHARRHTLLEVTIAAALLAGIVALATTMLFGTQRSLATSSAMQWSSSEAHRLAGLLALELRDLNYVECDVYPCAPLESDAFQYRVVTGYDAALAQPILDPSRESGAFRRLVFSPQAGTIVRETPSGSIVLGRRVADLRFSLMPPDRLKIRVVVERRTSSNEVSRGVAESIVPLRNRVP